MYDFKNSLFPNFLLIHRAKYVFSRDMFCLPYFSATIHCVHPSSSLDYKVHCSLIHTVNFCSEMGQAKHVSGKNIFCSMNVYKSRGKRIFEIVHWPFELPPNQHQPTGPFGWHKWCSLARPSKGQCTISKILSFLIFSLFIEQNIFFPETCFAYTISEPKFTVCTPEQYQYEYLPRLPLHLKIFKFLTYLCKLWNICIIILFYFYFK